MRREVLSVGSTAVGGGVAVWSKGEAVLGGTGSRESTLNDQTAF